MMKLSRDDIFCKEQATAIKQRWKDDRPVDVLSNGKHERGQAGNLDMVLLQAARTKKVYINVCNAIMTAQSESKPIKYCPYCGRKL